MHILPIFGLQKSINSCTLVIETHAGQKQLQFVDKSMDEKSVHFAIFSGRPNY